MGFPQVESENLPRSVISSGALSLPESHGNQPSENGLNTISKETPPSSEAGSCENDPNNNMIQLYGSDPGERNPLEFEAHLVIEKLPVRTSVDAICNIFGRYGRISKIFCDYNLADQKLTVRLYYQDETSYERALKMENKRRVENSSISVRQEGVINTKSSDDTAINSNFSKRGILKYPRGWQRRAFSESNADDCDYNLATCTDGLSNSLDCLSLSSDSPDDSQKDEKPKKFVHFSNAVSKTTFFQNSAILSKNRAKRIRRRTARLNNNRYQNLDRYQICSRLSLRLDETFEKLEGASDGEQSPEEMKKGRLRQDSGYDSETNHTHSSNKHSKGGNNKSKKFTVKKVDLTV